MLVMGEAGQRAGRGWGLKAATTMAAAGRNPLKKKRRRRGLEWVSSTAALPRMALMGAKIVKTTPQPLLCSGCWPSMGAVMMAL
jgi:hypothetical protein